MKKNSIVPAPVHPLDDNAVRVAELLDDWWKDKSVATRRSYKESLEEFKKFRGAKSSGEAVKDLCRLSHGEANQVALKFKNWLREGGGKPNTVNARLSALKSIVASFNMAGLCPWVLNCKGERAVAYKDTKGPASDKYQMMLDYARGQDNKKQAAREYAILRLLGSQAFRRNGVASLNVEHVSLEDKFAWILLKGSRVERTKFTLSDEVVDSIRAWLKIRGTDDGPLFPGRGGKGRICGGAIWSMVQRIGNECGIDVHPHSLRHLGVREALEATNGDVRATMAFSGHRNVNTVMIYADNLTDVGGSVARKVGKKHE